MRVQRATGILENELDVRRQRPAVGSSGFREASAVEQHFATRGILKTHDDSPESRLAGSAFAH
jgi:hypothetical protein